MVTTTPQERHLLTATFPVLPKEKHAALHLNIIFDRATPEGSTIRVQKTITGMLPIIGTLNTALTSIYRNLLPPVAIAVNEIWQGNATEATRHLSGITDLNKTFEILPPITLHIEGGEIREQLEGITISEGVRYARIRCELNLRGKEAVTSTTTPASNRIKFSVEGRNHLLLNMDTSQIVHHGIDLCFRLETTIPPQINKGWITGEVKYEDAEHLL